MDGASQSWALIFAWVVIGSAALFGIGVLYSRSTNIERTNLVGALTLVGAVISAFMLRRTEVRGGPTSWGQTIGIVAIAWCFFFFARLLDYYLGPVKVDREADEDTMGAHLSD